MSVWRGCGKAWHWVWRAVWDQNSSEACASYLYHCNLREKAGQIFEDFFKRKIEKFESVGVAVSSQLFPTPRPPHLPKGRFHVAGESRGIHEWAGQHPLSKGLPQVAQAR